MVNQKTAVSDKRDLDVKLEWDAYYKDEVMRLGYTSQLRRRAFRCGVDRER